MMRSPTIQDDVFESSPDRSSLPLEKDCAWMYDDLPAMTRQSWNLVRFCRHLPQDQLADEFRSDFAFRAEGSRFSILKDFATLPGPDACFSHIQLDARLLFRKLLGIEWEFPGSSVHLRPYASINYFRSHVEELFHVTAPTCRPAPPVRGRCVIYYSSTDVLAIEYELHNVSCAAVDVRTRWISIPEPGLAHHLTVGRSGFRHSCRQKVLSEYEAVAEMSGLPFREAEGQLETDWQDFVLAGGERKRWNFEVRFNDAPKPEIPFTLGDAIGRMEDYYLALPDVPAHLARFKPLALRAAGIVQSCRYLETTPDGERLMVIHGGKAGVEAMWFWDTCITALGSGLMNDSVTGWNSFLHLCKGIQPDGRPFYRYHDGQYEAGAQNPILAWGIWNFHTLSPNLDALEEAYPALCRYVNWWLDNWSEPSGLCSFARGEGCLGLDDALSTMEDCPIALKPGEKWFEKDWGAKTEFLFEAPDLNAHLYLEMQALALMAATLGRDLEASSWRSRAGDFRSLIHERLFNPEAGIYQTRRTTDGRFSGMVGADSFLPVFAGIAPEPIARQICRKYLLNPEKFYTPMPFATMDRSHEAFRSGGSLYEPPGWPGALVQQSYWQGRSWMNYNYFLVGALNQAGLHAEADAAVLKILDVVSRHETIYECYDPLTGSGTGHAEFPWAAGATLAMLFGLYREGALRRDPLATQASTKRRGDSPILPALVS